jgi:hypothetical protein
MKIFINEKEIEIFGGADIESAVRLFDKAVLGKIKKGKSEVCDKHGNHIDISGELHENSRIFIKKTSK